VLTRIITIIVVLSACFLLSFEQIPVKKLLGNWVSKQDVSLASPDDTITFEKKKYSPQLFTQPGYFSGFTFREDSTFTEYHSIVNDPGTDNVFYPGERFVLVSDSIIEVKGYSRNFKFRIISLASKKMSIKLIP
jgi:hypothetical protein